ncbi:carbamoyltransferase C-terminal domain-containing protein [Cycloclasticus pugetii]|uniref:carbamoyltransferase C-terminal domain-containing protein n=1 Tax=Cycloclasticus pugetii TaxID=34068 RepID=UPI003A95D942
MALTILGLSGALSHAPSAALHVDDKLIASLEEERFVCNKHAKNRMPYESVKFCLEQARITPVDADVIGYRRYKQTGKGFYFSPKLIEWLGAKFEGDTADAPYVHYAASMRTLFERLALEMMDCYLGDILRDTGKIAFAGICALNVKLSQRIIARPELKELFVQPASGGAGASVVGAAYISKQNGVPVEKMEHVFFGPSYSNEGIIAASAGNPNQPQWKLVDNAPEYIVDILAEGNPVAWFQGRMKSSPRALGGRSILGCPSVAGMSGHIIYDLMTHLPRLTGNNVVLNTVLNRRCESVVYSPKDAAELVLWISSALSDQGRYFSGEGLKAPVKGQTVKRVLQLCHGYDGPFLDCVRQYAALFDGTDYKVTTVFLTGKKDLLVADKCHSDEVIFMDYSSAAFRRLKLKAIRELRKIGGDHDFTLCIAPRSESTYIACLETSLPVIGVHHAFDDFARLGRRFFAKIFRERLHLLGVCDAVRDYIRRCLPNWPLERIQTLYNRIDANAVQGEQLELVLARVALRLPAEAWVIGNVGRLHPDKDQATLLRAFAEALPSLPVGSFLAILGKERLEQRLKGQASLLGVSDQVVFMGMVPEARRYFKVFDAFALSSDHEPYGMVLWKP